MMPVIGVDGCRAGWIAVRWGEAPTHMLCRTFAEVLELDGVVIAVDMPVGFAEDGKRSCESLARAKLGQRQSSVFAVPSRAAVMCEDYREACAANLLHSSPPKKVSKQIFHIFPKMREIDALMSPALQSRVFEAHPELAFWAMNGETPLDLPKKVKGSAHEPGLALRRSLLQRAGFPLDDLQGPSYKPAEAGADDLLDACACAWVARRILIGKGRRFPPDPPRDAKGLCMEINA